MNKIKTNYGAAIRSAFDYLLRSYPDTFIIGQGVWSPWYVGNTMTDLEKKFGKDRVIDTPVSESACTGAAVGASITGMRPIVVHPRIDFMLYAMDAIVNQAAKWSSMTGGQSNPNVTIRGIINRGGEQGAQHSQALHNWFVHVPGLRVVMPSTVSDARDLLIASVLSPDPVVYIDDRWLYDEEDDLEEINEIKLSTQKPKITTFGSDVTLVGSGHSSLLLRNCEKELRTNNISPEIIDIRILNPLNVDEIIKSVRKTRNLVVVDSGTLTGGFSGEIIASVVEKLEVKCLNHPPVRIALPDAPAPTSSTLEDVYYVKTNEIINTIKRILKK